MRARHLFLSLILCALPHAAAAAAPTAVAPPEAMTIEGTDTDGCGIAYVGGEAAGGPDYHVPAPVPEPIPAPLDLDEESALDVQSYADVYGILKDENECSRFFGGPAHSVKVFNELTRKLKRRPLGDRAVGVRMTGSFMTFRDHQTGAVYRLFEEATVNTDGPLFSKGAAHDRNKVSRVGSFPTQSRAGKALVYLHELGHMVGRADGSWLLPNDGDNREQSERNTRTVEKNCADQLTALGE